ncbi:MAG: hypothetical protein ACRYGP_05955 [Janthinobacterium lividum]
MVVRHAACGDLSLGHGVELLRHHVPVDCRLADEEEVVVLPPRLPEPVELLWRETTLDLVEEDRMEADEVAALGEVGGAPMLGMNPLAGALPVEGARGAFLTNFLE